MSLRLYQVDAFADRLFAGNPAAVVPLDQWLPDPVLQSIAIENNLSETAFLVPAGGDFELRWFTPSQEINLCGHATLASAFVLSLKLPHRRRFAFHTRYSGTLLVDREGDRFVLDFPAWQAAPVAAPAGLAATLGGPEPQAVLASEDYLVVYADAGEVAALAPDFREVAKLDKMVIATAPGRDGVDFVSRFFAPLHGIDEDPVTGRAHCTLIPYWAARLGRSTLEARQLSKRGGSLRCGAAGERVRIGGQAVLYLEGELHLPELSSQSSTP
jgi:predicted PhzF superfamily epimerase YddE/YHI9